MERNGDVVAEFNNCHPENFQLSSGPFETEYNIMCKDDNSESLFCKMSGKMRSDNIMDSEFRAQAEVSISDLKNQCLEKLNSTETDFVKCDEHMLSIIKKKTEDAMNNCLLPIWEKTSELCGFPSDPSVLSEDSFINGGNILDAAKSTFNNENSYTNSSAIYTSDSSLSATSPDSLLQHSGEDLSSSSIEEIFCPVSCDLNDLKKQYSVQHGSKRALETALVSKETSIVTVQKRCPLQNRRISSGIPKLDHKEEFEACPKNDLMMPELIPTICLDDDDSIPSEEKKDCEVVNVADSPEMPKLVPFSTDVEEIIKIKKERLDDNEPKKNCIVQLETAKRMLFFEKTIVSTNDAKTGKSENAELQCFTEFRSPPKILPCEIGHLGSEIKGKPRGSPLENSLFGEFGTGNSFESASVHSKDLWRSENSKSRISFSGIHQHIKEIKKTKHLNLDTKCASENNESQDSDDNPHHPKVILRRLSLDQCLSLNSSDRPEISVIDGIENESKFSFKHCLPSNDSDDNDSLASRPECQENKNSSNESPEIEEIEGMRFFQFHTKYAMEEFNKKPLDLEMDVEMIVPTKTNDITQIKGWRNKYFAPESQFQSYCLKNENSIDESSQNAVSLPPLEEQTDSQCLDFHSHESIVEPSPGKETNCSENLRVFERDSESVSEATKTPSKTVPGESAQPSTIELPEKKVSQSTVLKNPLSAFVSKELDDFLLNSSTLNVNYLQKINPNIIPIAPDAPILSIGKLSKNDKDWNVYERRKFFYKVKDEHKDPVPADDKTDDSTSPIIILSSSCDSSSDDDVPVAILSRKSNRVTSRLKRPIANKRTKRSISDSSTDQTAQRLVLRLTKESRGASEGYKVSDISLEKEESSSSSSSTSSSSNSESEELPDAFKISSDGTLPIIKDTIFLKDTEPKLLEEFLNNLNMYGTSKDVAMLVESNQSYFVKGPVLTAEHCSEALDALLSNKEFLDSKSKATPKKKLKAWQKYLPKKLSKAQQQQISNKSSHQQKSNLVNVTSESSEKTLNVKDNFKQDKREEQQAYNKKPQQLKTSNSKEKIKQSKFDGIGKISNLNVNAKAKVGRPQKVLGIKRNLKSKHLALEKNTKIKRKPKLHIDASDQLALIERGKRSIRLPARYLDSAVLAAGSEWVSPIFIEDDKKSRKQLLDVLGKITPIKETDTHAEETKTENNLTSPKQLLKKKSVEGYVKSLKRPLKGSVNSKKLKVDHNQQNTKLTKVVKSQEASPDLNLLSNNKSASPNGSIYSLPSCPCTPCSRTSSFQRKKKLFVCLTNHFKKRNDIDWEKVDQKSETVKKIKVNNKSEIKEPERKNSVMEKKSTLTPDNVTPVKSNFDENSVTECNVSSANITVPASLNTLYASSSTATSVVSENYQSQSSSLSKTILSGPPLQAIHSNNNSNLLLPPVYDKDLIVPNEIFSNGQLLNVTGGGAGNKVLLIVPPPVHNSPKNTKVPIKSNPLSIQTTQKISSENRSKPPILARKMLTEIPTKSTNSESSKLINFSEYNSINSPKSIVLSSISPAVANNNSFNPSPVFLKLPRVVEKTDNCLPLLYGPPQLNPVTRAPVLNSILDNSSIISSPCSSQQKVPLMKAIKFGDKVYLYPSETNSSLNNSSYSSLSNGIGHQCNSAILTVQTSEIPSSNNCSPILLQTVLKTGALSNSNGSEHNLSASVKEDTSNVHKSSSEPIADHHNYHKKQSSEHRRKSPLSKRKFKDDSGSEVDVDTVDQDFDATLELKKQRFMGSDSDISDDECAKIFSSTVTGVINANKTKTVNERKRRLLIKTMFDKLKSTSSYFKSANNFKDILGMATYVIHEYERKHEAYVKAKRILHLRNAQLLKKMNDVLQGVKDVKFRNLLKKQMIQTLALDWEKHRLNRSCVLSPLQTKNASASSEVETSQSHVPPPSDEHREKDVIVAELDIEVEDSSKGNVECGSSMDFQISEVCAQTLLDSEVSELPQFNCSTPVQPRTGLKIAEHHVMDIDVVEQPHVQLRILEAPLSSGEIETSLQTDERLTESKGMTPSNSCVEASTPVPRAAKRLHLKGSCDATTSDDDHLVIDLSDDSSNPEDKSLPHKDADLQKSTSINHSTPLPAVGEDFTMKKFPGLIPLFASNFYDDASGLEIVGPKSISRTKSLDEGVVQNDSDHGVNQKIVAKRTSISGLLSLQPGNSCFLSQVEDESSELPGKQQNPSDTSDFQTSEGQVNSELTASRKLLDSSKVQKLPLKNGQTPLSFGTGLSSPKAPPSVNSDVPRHTMHRTCNDVRILHGVGPTYQDSLDAADVKCKLTVPEEIVIEDSDDEVMEINESPQGGASASPAGSSRHDVGGVNSKQESQVLALNL